MAEETFSITKEMLQKIIRGAYSDGYAMQTMPTSESSAFEQGEKYADKLIEVLKTRGKLIPAVDRTDLRIVAGEMSKVKGGFYAKP